MKDKIAINLRYMLTFTRISERGKHMKGKIHAKKWKKVF